MEQPTISVIVPVYNVEKYLSDCIESIINQTFTDLEIILINDGSTDRSGEICDEYALKDNRIKVIHKENGGASSARNIGIKKARGTYIAFVDSDDWLDENTYLKMYECIQGNKVEIVFCKMIFTNEIGGEKQLVKELIQEGEISKYEFSNLLVAPMIGKDIKDKTEGIVACNIIRCLFLRKVILDHDLLFNENLILGEDAIFIIKYLAYIKSAYVLDHYFYYYRINLNSTTHKYQQSLFEKIKLYLYEVKTVIETLYNCDVLCNERLHYSTVTYIYWSLMNELKCSEKSYFNKCLSIHSILNNPLTKKNFKIKTISGYSNKIKLVMLLFKYRIIYLLGPFIERALLT